MENGDEPQSVEAKTITLTLEEWGTIRQVLADYAELAQDCADDPNDWSEGESAEAWEEEANACNKMLKQI